MTASGDLQPAPPTLRPPELHAAVRSWYTDAARDLPWRRPATTPWAVLVSEVMLQQTPVARVLPAYDAWLARWPTPADLAVEAAGAAVRQWGRLGYPRRALRLHAAARVIVERHGGAVPDDLEALLALPGVGGYTARAVAAFAFRQRHAVLDTNVRRVLARVLDGHADAPAAVTTAEQRRAEELLPLDADEAATYAVAVMELGALLCTAREPRCQGCPLADRCAWQAAGRPATPGVGRRPQAYAGTDRQVRGRLLGVLRDADGPVAADVLAAVWGDDGQRDRALAGLLDDGLVEPADAGGSGYRLPTR